MQHITCRPTHRGQGWSGKGSPSTSHAGLPTGGRVGQARDRLQHHMQAYPQGDRVGQARDHLQHHMQAYPQGDRVGQARDHLQHHMQAYPQGTGLVRQGITFNITCRPTHRGQGWSGKGSPSTSHAGLPMEDHKTGAINRPINNQ